MPPAAKKRVIIFAMDASDCSKAALRWGLENHIRPHDQLVLLSAGDSSDKIVESAVKDVKELAVTQFGEAAAKEMTIMRSPVKGKDPREAIVDNVSELRADCLIMGSRGLSGLKRQILGSVSDYCVRTIQNCAVIIVKN